MYSLNVCIFFIIFRIGPSYLKVMNLSKKKKRKRKAEGSAELPEQKRLTFSGVFPSNSVNAENNFSRDCLLSNDASVSNDKFILSDTLKRNENVSNANDKMDLDLTNNDISSNFGEVDSHASLDRETISNNDIVSSNFTEIDSHASLEKEINISCSKEKIKQGDYVKELDVSGKDGESSVIFSNVCMKDKDKIDQVFEKGIETDSNVDAFEKDAESSVTFSNVCMKDKNKIDLIFEKGSEADNNEMEINEVNVSMKDRVKIGQAFEKVSETGNNVGAFEKDGESSVTFSNLYMKDKNKIDHVFEKENGADNNETEINEVNICMIDKQNKIDQIFEKEREIDNNEIEINEVNDNENGYNVKENIIDVENVNDNEIDVENINEESVRSNNDGDTNEVIIEDEKSDVNVEDLGSGVDDDNEEYESTDESIPVVCEDSSEGSLDVYSCSPTEHQNDKDLSIEAENVISKPSKVQDEEVTLVRVMKKEKKPLAVIDLLSDEEDNGAFRIHKSGNNTQNGKNMFEDSDEEIQVLDEVAGTASNKELSQRSVSAIKLESGKLKTESSNVQTQFKPQMKYPDTFRKDMICISRPFINLLPLHCQPAKEAYVLYTEKSSQPRSSQPRSNRLWNSYKDLQEYQRQRREKQRESKRNYFASRSSGSFRDQNDTFSNQISPFSTPEYSRDFGNDRNHNYPARPSRSFYQLANSEREGGGLLPTPGNFNSPNQLPFSMNVHNLQNLSTTNPTAFINEFQKNVYSVATNMISTMLNQHLNPINSQPAYPPAFNNSNFMNFNPHPNNNFSGPPAMPDPMAYNSSDRNDFQPVRFPPEPSFFGERHPASMNESPFMMENNWKQNNNFPQRNFTPRGPSFPCKYRAVRRKRNWNDVKAAVEGANLSDSGSDIEEVPINLNRFLYSNDIKPLIDPGKKLPVGKSNFINFYSF